MCGIMKPHIALTPGGDGLSAYREIAAKLASFLSSNGRAVLEIGKDQGENVSEIFAATGIGPVAVYPDLNGHARIVAVNARFIGETSNKLVK